MKQQGLKDRKQYLDYCEWIVKKYHIKPILHPVFVKEFLEQTKTKPVTP